MPASTDSSLDPAVERRIDALLSVASEFGTGVTLHDLVRLLPANAEWDSFELQGWLAGRPDLTILGTNRVYRRSTVPLEVSARQTLGLELETEARRWLPEGLAWSLPWTLCVGLSGSVAFGEPQLGDDLDFFVVTRRGAVWVFLLLTYLSARLRPRPAVDGKKVTVCFNYVTDDRSAQEDFVLSRGLQLAREALSVRILTGEAYYQGLLRLASWMEGELPRMYAERLTAPPRMDAPPAPWPVRWLNLGLFPVVAAYLQFVGLFRNARAVRRGNPGGRFRTSTRLRRLSFFSMKWDRLSSHYRRDAPPEARRPTAEL